MPSGEWAGLDPADGCFWNDANRDGIPQRAECVIVPAVKKGVPLRVYNGWGGRIGPDFSLYGACNGYKMEEDGVIRYRPLRITPDGAPVYGPEGMEKTGMKGPGEMIPSSDGKRLVCMGSHHNADRPFPCFNLADKKVEWSYPNHYPGVHGSHNAPMPKPGLLIGPIKACGLADLGKEIGEVMYIRGNLGQNFLFTMDGLFVAAMMQDTRLPYEALPDREELLIGVPMETRTEGGEPFSGWFGRQDDGKVRATSGMAGQAGMILEIKGLETIRRFDAGTLPLDEATLAKALADNAAREAKAKASAKLVLTRSRDAAVPARRAERVGEDPRGARPPGGHGRAGRHPAGLRRQEPLRLLRRGRPEPLAERGQGVRAPLQDRRRGGHPALDQAGRQARTRGGRGRPPHRHRPVGRQAGRGPHGPGGSHGHARAAPDLHFARDAR